MAAVGISAAACGHGAPNAKTAGADGTMAGLHACAGSVPTRAEPIGRPGTSGTVALAKIAGRRVALIADDDAKAIVTVDLDTHAELATTPLGGTPGQVYIAKDGHVFATVRDKNAVVMLAASRAESPLTVACGATTPSEPIAIGGTPNDDRLIVTSGWGRRVTVFNRPTLARQFEVPVAREPRSVVVTDDGKTAYVSHAVGSLVTLVDLDGTKHSTKEVPLRPMTEQGRQLSKGLQASRVRTLASRASPDAASKRTRLTDGLATCQGFALAKSTAIAGRIFAPEVAVDPGDPSTRPDGYGSQHKETEVPNVAVLDEATSTPLTSSLDLETDINFRRLTRDARDESPECLLPRAAAIDPATKSLLVTCYGIDAVIAYDATAATPLAAERRRWSVGSGPSGVAIDVEKGRGVVWSQFDRTLSTFAIGGVTPEVSRDRRARLAVDKTKLSPLPTLSPEYTLGRILFHAAGDRRIASDGRACASCHPDGRDDAITWATPEGPRRSIMLAGRVNQSSPYAWNGEEKTLEGHLGNTFDRLSGSGLRSIELEALMKYISSLPSPPPAPVSQSDEGKVARGKEIFASHEAGCANCHTGTNSTDGLNHDVGSRGASDRAAAFNTPTLHLVGGTGPYFHDGRYATLSDLLVQSDGKMGHTKHLNNADIEALETFLRTL